MSTTKTQQKKSFLFIATLFFCGTKACLAWDGYDYDNKTAIEIETGNLVREGLVIQFYDSKANDYHAAKVLFMESDAGGTRIQLQDLDSQKERVFIMQN